jgi:[acyl-carrier-protein] S-malonyltransferase
VLSWKPPLLNPKLKSLFALYQNIDAKPYTDPEHIKHNLIAQLTGAVSWTQTVMHMLEDGATSFTEVGPGNVLQGLVKKVDRLFKKRIPR